MTTTSYVAEWRKRLGFRIADAAEALGISPSAYSQYEKGVRRGTRREVDAPRYIRLALTAIAFRLPPYDELGDIDARMSELMQILADDAASTDEKLAAARAFVAAGELTPVPAGAD